MTPIRANIVGPPVSATRIIRLPLPIGVLDALRSEAHRRGLETDELAEAILKNVVTDDLYAAVIDR